MDGFVLPNNLLAQMPFEFARLLSLPQGI